MESLMEHLYSYVTDMQYQAMRADEEYMLSEKNCIEARKQLLYTLSKEQKELLECYEEAENYASSLELRHLFRETLALVRLTPAIQCDGQSFA